MESLIRNVYDELCSALTKAEHPEEFPDYTMDCFYEDILNAHIKLQNYLGE